MRLIKTIYLTLGVALLLSSCSTEDTPEPTRNPGENRILFRTSLPGISSRARVVTKDNLPYFQVTAFNPNGPTSGDNLLEYFNDECIEKENGSEIYSSEKCCWPIADNDGTMTFFAYYPSVLSMKQTVGEDWFNFVNDSHIVSGTPVLDYRIENFRIADDIADHFDFISASATGSLAENLFKGIDLSFAHQLSRVEIKAYGANKSCDIEIAGIRIGGIGVENTFVFNLEEGGGKWSGEPSRGSVEYIFRRDDEIISMKKASPVGADDAIAIIGADKETCAMLLPSTYVGWDHINDPYNDNGGMYLSILLRIIDATDTDGKGTQQYPYTDGSQDPNTLVYIAVDEGAGTSAVKRLYKQADEYFADAECNESYTLQDNEVVKEFGWAALPVKGEWEAGYTYTYTLDYSSGVGLHDPSSPKAGTSIFSDKVGITVSVKPWDENKISSDHEVPGS